MRAAPLSCTQVPGSQHRNTTSAPACWEHASTWSQCNGLEVHGPGTCSKDKKGSWTGPGRQPSAAHTTRNRVRNHPTDQSPPTRLHLTRSRPVFGFQLWGLPVSTASASERCLHASASPSGQHLVDAERLRLSDRIACLAVGCCAGPKCRHEANVAQLLHQETAFSSVNTSSQVDSCHASDAAGPRV